jgi:hypothetical protein
MNRSRALKTRALLLAVFLAFSGLMLLAATVMAEVPATVDSYGGNAFAAGIHVIAGSNNDPNFSQGAIGNRYPLAQAGQDISPASAAQASLTDYGPLVATQLGMDCNAGPPSPVPPLPGPKKPPNYCLEQVRADLPYANAQFPHPPGVGDQTITGVQGIPLGSASAHAGELAASADSAYAGVPAAFVTVSNVTAHSETSVAKDGSITVKTHSHVGSICIGTCNVADWLTVSNTVVDTVVTALNGRSLPSAVVSPGRVEFCQLPGKCNSVQVSNEGVTIGGGINLPKGVPSLPSTVSIPGLGGNAATALFKIRTIDPLKVVNGTTGSVDAFGLDVEIMQPGNAAAGVPDAQVEFIIGEGHADGFSLASLGGTNGITDLTSLGGGDLGGGVTGIIGDIVGGNNGGSSAGTALPRVRHTTTGNAGGIALAGALRPPFILWFYAWEASALAAAAAMVWARRRRLSDAIEEGLST